MGIAAAISLSVSPTTRYSVAAFNPLRSSSSAAVSVPVSSSALWITTLSSNLPFRNPSFRVLATSMSIQAPDRRESGGVLRHFVKYTASATTLSWWTIGILLNLELPRSKPSNCATGTLALEPME